MKLRRADSVAELDALEPLWNALHAHNAEISPDLGPAPARWGLPSIVC